MGARGEESVHIDAKSLLVKVPRGQPRSVEGPADWTADETKVAIALDPTKPDGPPNVAFVARSTLGKMLSATIPRTQSSLIGIPTDFLPRRSGSRDRPRPRGAGDAYG